jgi:general secretion pathway protein I
MLFRAGGGGLVAVDAAARVEEAVQRAQSHLAALGRDAALLQGESEGDDGGGYRWRLRVTPLAAWPARPSASGAAGAGSTLYDVEVTISWPASGAARRSVVLRTRRIAAAAAGG